MNGDIENTKNFGVTWSDVYYTSPWIKIIKKHMGRKKYKVCGYEKRDSYNLSLWFVHICIQ